MAASDAKPDPIRGVAYRVTFPMFDSAGDLVSGATGLDSEVSKDGGAFADCTNEATEIITSSGIYYLDLTSTEMAADTVAVIVKASDAQTTPLVLYPRRAPIRSVLTTGTATAGANSSITLAATESTTEDLFKWCVISILAGTGAGQSRICTAYSTGRVATVSGDWATNPSTDSVYEVTGLGAEPISSEASANLEAAAGTMIQEAVQASPTPTTTAFAGSSALSSVDDFYNGRIIGFLDGALENQYTVIEDYTGATKLFTVAALTSAPASAVAFIII
jgi:hypothetical protein